MSFGSRLRDKRNELNITQGRFSDLVFFCVFSFSAMEYSLSSTISTTLAPSGDLLYDLFEILHCDANYLFQDETRELYKNEATPEEFENIIKKYRFISTHSPEGASVVDMVLMRGGNHIDHCGSK